MLALEQLLLTEFLHLDQVLDLVSHRAQPIEVPDHSGTSPVGQEPVESMQTVGRAASFL